MNHGTIIKAYKSIGKIAEQKLPMTTAYKVFKLREKLKPAWDFLVEEEGKLLDDYKPTIQENGTIIFRSIEDKQAYDQRISEIYTMESDIQIEPVSIPLTDDIFIAPDDIAALEPVVSFQ